MKSIILSLLASVVVASAATTITATNAASGTSGFLQQVIVAQDGLPFVGSVMIGTFTTTTNLGVAGEIDLADFGWTLFGSAPFSSNTAYKGVFGAFGGTGVTGNLPTAAGGPFIGNNIFAVVANGAGEYIIWDSGLKFAVEDAVLGGAAVSFQTRNATLIRGLVDPNGNNGITGTALTARNGQAAVAFLAPVPETSTSLLGALGALVLLRRRRN